MVKLNRCVFHLNMMTYQKKNTIWYKVSSDIGKKNDKKPVYNKKYLKKKLKPYGNAPSYFLDKEVPKVSSNHTC